MAKIINPARITLFSALGILLLSLCLSCDTVEKSRARLSSDAVVLAFGDSLTVGKGVTPEFSYPRVLEKIIGRSVISSGVSGEVSSNGLIRLKAVLTEEDADLLILCHGGNDILRRKPATKTKENLRKMILLAKEENIPVLLIGVPGFSLGLGNDPLPIYDELAEEFDLLYESDALPTMLHDKAYKSDTVHLNEKGYRRLAEEIAEVLRNSGSI
jgi:lysophospholipase L1-like esterase